MDGEQLEEVGLLVAADALQLQDAAEVGVGPVGEVDQVGLDEGLGRRGAHLEGLEERVDARHGCVDALDEAGRGRWVLVLALEVVGRRRGSADKGW